MGLEWVYPMDALAAGGVIDFDAPAFILDKPSRYAGSPGFEDIANLDNSNLLPKGTKIKDQPKSDEYAPGSKDNRNPAWKKWLAGGAVIALAAGLGLKGLSKAGKIKLPKIRFPDMSKARAYIKNACSKVLNVIKKPFVWIAGKFKKP